MKLAIGSIVAALVAFALITWWALESSGVALLETRARAGGLVAKTAEISC